MRRPFRLEKRSVYEDGRSSSWNVEGTFSTIKAAIDGEERNKFNFGTSGTNYRTGARYVYEFRIVEKGRKE